MALTTEKLRARLAITGNETERRLVTHIASLITERDIIKADLKKTHSMLDWALDVVEKAQETCHSNWCSDDGGHAAFCDYLTESLEKARTDLGIKKA